MYNKGDLIIYSNKGVCRVLDITGLGHEDAAGGRMYYVLNPLNTPANTLFVPTDNSGVVMRYLITREEARELIDSIPQAEDLEVPSEKLREQTYKDCMRTADCGEYIRLVKTLNHRRKSRQAIGKKVTATDDRYTKLVEEALYPELALQLGLPRAEVADMVRTRINVG